MTRGAITVGVPVYRGEAFVEETLRSVQAQSYDDLRVLISLDGADEAAEARCRPYLRDSRFSLVVQPQRLGWIDNLNWLMARVETPYWCYVQQDDVLDPRYFETLAACLQGEPDAAVAYCDIEAFGARSGTFAQEPVRGSAVARQLALLQAHPAAVAFRGLTRVEALRLCGRIPANEVEGFACDAAWMAAVARWGGLYRVPETLYRKRYHAANEHLRWDAWPLAKRARGWVVHCAAMLDQALRVDASLEQRRILWRAALERVISLRSSARYLPISEFSADERSALLVRFVDEVQRSDALGVPRLLDESWEGLRAALRGFAPRLGE